MTQDQPNILFICVDQWRGDTLRALGHPLVRTPTIDRLCAEGVTFARHFTQGVPCAPARASMHTGMYTMNHRVVQNRTPLDAGFTNLALELRKHGYEPGLIGYTTTAIDPRPFPENDPVRRQMNAVLPGFRSVRTVEPENQRDYYGYLAANGYPQPEDPADYWRPDPADPRAQDGTSTAAPWLVKAEHSDTAWYTEAALEFIHAQKHNPWMLHLGYFRPHPPCLAPAPYHEMYAPADCPPPARLPSAAEQAAQHPFVDWMLSTQQASSYFRHGTGLISELDAAAIAQLRATYYGLMSEIDDQLARVVALLEETGQWERTLVIFTSDHGEELGDHYMLNKHGFYDASFHIPLVIRDPRPAANATRGTVVEALTGNIDDAPTVLDWIGAPIPRQMDGRSLLPFCHGKDPDDWRQEIFFESDFRDIVSEVPQKHFGLHMDECGLAVLRDQRWSYVHFAALPPLLFDIVEDPGQLHNLASDPAYAQVIAELRERMLRWRLVEQNRTLTGIGCWRNGYVERV
jgi:arylsulfatase A-like enzyme